MEELNLVEVIKILKVYWKLIAAFVIACTVIVTVIIFFVITPQYKSSSQILVNRSREGEIIQGGDIDTNVRLISTYKDIIKSPMILDEVREELGIELTHGELSGKINLSNEANSQVFTMEVTNTSPQQAALIANIISLTFQERVGEMMNVDNVTILSSAVANPIPVFPNKPISIVVGLIIGFGIGIGAAFLFYFADNTVKDEKFITDKLEWTPLGQIEEVSNKELEACEIEEAKDEMNNSAALKSRV